LISGLFVYSSFCFPQYVYSDGEYSPTEEMKLELTQLQWAEENRQVIVNHILDKIQTEAETMELIGWREQISALLMNLTVKQLLNAYDADTYTGVVTAIRGYEVSKSRYKEFDMEKTTARKDDTGIFRKFKSKSANLTYTPIEQCRLVDTRHDNNPSPIPVGKMSHEVRKFSINFLPQYFETQIWRCALGNHDEDVSDVIAVHMNITATEAAADGYFAIGPVGGNVDYNNTSILNYGPDETSIANAAIVEMGLGGEYEFEVFSSAKTHLAIDIIGYFTQPKETKLSIERLSKLTPVEPNTSAKIFSPTCPADTSWTSGGVMHDSDLVYTLALAQNSFTYNNLEVYPGNTACLVKNESNETVSVTCNAYCSTVTGDSNFD